MRNYNKIIAAIAAMLLSATMMAAGTYVCCPQTGPEDQQGTAITESMELLQPAQQDRLPSYLSEPDAIILPSEVAVPAINIAEIIAGRVAGVYVRGSYLDYQIRIRGSQGPPLIVLDFLPFNGYDDEQVNDLLRTIPAADVESIEIIKNIAQAAIYGPNAGNGVIKINTKR